MNKSVVRVFPLLLCLGGCHFARVPKIYNALISSDESLQPSRAFPVFEPVLRTTNLGISAQIPPLVVQPQIQEAPGDKKGQQLLTAYTGNLYPVAYDPYLIYPYHREFLYPTQPFYHQPVFLDLARYDDGHNKESSVQSENEPAPSFAQSAVHLKKNPDIPDVPPPPLRTNTRNKAAQSQ